MKVTLALEGLIQLISKGEPLYRAMVDNIQLQHYCAAIYISKESSKQIMQVMDLLMLNN